jgi:hypothetical protein
MSRLSREEFISRVSEVRSDIDFGSTSYNGMRTKVLIKCDCCKKYVRVWPRHLISKYRIDCDCEKTNFRGFGKPKFGA